MKNYKGFNYLSLSSLTESIKDPNTPVFPEILVTEGPKEGETNTVYSIGVTIEDVSNMNEEQYDTLIQGRIDDLAEAIEKEKAKEAAGEQ